jgi:carbonic anhydrase
MLSPHAALERLREGNRRFATGELSHDTRPSHSKVAARADQAPFAIILGCSDSRVPAELVFGQGIGDLFVIRVAGNIIAPSLVGSVEFAASKFGTRLVVVLGHSGCGAIKATLESLRNPDASRSSNLQSIVDRVRPAVQALFDTDLRQDEQELVRQAVRANIRVSVGQLKSGSAILEDLILEDGLEVVGAEYSIETGVVAFLGDIGS